MTDTDSLEIKKRSRRRLVGAAALALLAAIVLPMVMDQEPRHPTQDIQITIPDRNADGGAAPVPRRAEGQAETEVAPPPEEEPVAAGPAPAPDPAPAPTPAAPPPASTPAAKPPVVAAPAPQPKPAPAIDEAARVQALLSGQTDVKPAPRGETLVVQVGAFGEAAKAASVAKELKALGFAAYTEQAGTMTRVRLGPFASRAEAEKVAERLRANGRPAVVAPR